MAPNNAINSFLLMLLLFPFSFCYDGSETITLIQRMETLEKRDKEKSIVIDRLTKTIADQERKIQVMDQTIENIMKDATQFSYTQQEKYKRSTKLQHDLSKLPEKNRNLLQFTSNDKDKILLQVKSTVSDKTRKPSSYSSFYANERQTKKESLEFKKSSEQMVKNMSISIERTGNNGEWNIQNRNEQLGRSKGRFVANIEGPVAFHAVSDKHNITHLGSNENIKFETILLNVGGGYHSQHGLFIAPKAGIYLFSTSVVTSGTKLYARITKNGAPLAKAFGLGNTVMNAQGSVTVTTQMNIGDEVWVKHIYPPDGSLWGERLTSFTGVLISNN
ncbi:uncharacterized protein LOC132737658 isoform X1 [Ruditapes philippinarum]|uniref:uncharacterized protein LOC132737658 isoform X1 n=1 Tax=Ruditapes philippinarum TaxID=129788 RepID=UPI00295AF759|nr:uncharacterized protein LOC132737658 isoform X1 [Ruditapes philippinarum]